MPKVSPIRKINEKWCCGCERFKLKTSFHKNKTRKDGLADWCKSCVKNFEKSFVRKRKLLKKSKLSWWIRKVNRPMYKGLSAEILFNQYQINSNCYYCGVCLKNIDIHFDHKIPSSKNGKTENKNIALCCKDCNSLKSNRTEQEFKSFLIEYFSRFEN